MGETGNWLESYCYNIGVQKKEADSGDYESRCRKIWGPAEHRDRIKVLSLNDLEGWGRGGVKHNVEPRGRAGLEALRGVIGQPG